MHASPAMRVILNFKKRSLTEPSQVWGRELKDAVASFTPVVGAAGDRLAHLCLFAEAEEIFLFLLGSEFSDAFGADAAMTDDLEPWEGRITFEREEDEGLYTGLTCLHIAILQGNTRLALIMLDKFPELAGRSLKGIAFKPRKWVRRRAEETGGRRCLPRRSRACDVQVNSLSSFDFGNTTMSLAVCMGNQVICEKIAATLPEGTLDGLAREQDCAGNTILHRVVQHRKYEVLRWLLRAVSDRRTWEIENNERFTPLTLSAILGYNDILHGMLTTPLYARTINVDFASHIDICCNRLVAPGNDGQQKDVINLLDCAVFAGLDSYESNTLAQTFVAEHWNKSGRKAYLRLVLFPFLLVMILAHVLYAVRAQEVQGNWMEAWANNCTANLTYRLECAKKTLQ
uniref:Uncharacterized protein n=1 Tax=Hanusia phi TaxID=3032 RepID=A0A7S0EUA3_9CRYP